MTASFLAIPLKRTSEVDLVAPLQSFIAATYSSTERPLDAAEALNEFQKLRNKALCSPLDRHESSLETLYRYSEACACV